MRSSTIGRAALVLCAISQNLVQAQFVSSLPQCIQDCIDQSQDENCSITDIKCLCRASAGNFLPDVVTCAHANCDTNLDNDLFLAPFQLICDIAGTPIPESAIHNAENQASTVAAAPTPATTTVTMGGGYSTLAPYTITVESVSVSVTTTTVTQTTGGTTLYLVYPITIDKTTTVSGAASTYTSVSTASPTNAFTESIPVVIISTDSAGSTYTSTTTELGAFSTYTTTDYEGSTVTQTSTFLATVVESQSSASSTSGAKTTSLAAQKTTSSAKSTAKPTSASSSSNDNGSPFSNQNAAAGREGLKNWLGLSVLLAVGIMWF